ncbi:MAG TPA: cupin, partial [Actinoplanes sp.]|nr:cupin [Actinoplanes sp.]
EALRDWLTSVEPAEIAERLRARDWPSARPEPVSPLAQLDFAAGLGPDDQLRVREGLRWQLTEDGPDHVVLRLVGRTMRFPATCASSLRIALGGELVRVGDLPLEDDADRLVLARRLLNEALVVPS